MPMINLEVSFRLDKQKKEEIVKELGRLIDLMPSRDERYLMIGIKDEVSIYLAGKELDYAAFMDLRLLGHENEEDEGKFVVAAQASLSELLKIPIENIYMNILEMPHWGARGIYETADNF